ncbi:MAG: hypothetical protein Q9186_003767 [Xanthomendoza sp. 1 TL-2023]
MGAHLSSESSVYESNSRAPLHPLPQTIPIGIQVRSLLPSHVAGIFMADGTHRACSKMPPFKSIRGPGSFTTPNMFRQPVSGVSYVVLPKVMPTDTTISEYLAAEGLLGLHTADRQWTAPGVSAQQRWFGTVARASGLKSRRSILRGQQGIAYIGPPPRGRFPDVVTVNGTEYHSTNTSSFEFRGADGQLLDTSNWLF